MKRTRHSFAEIWKQGGHFVMKRKNGQFQEMTDPSDRSYMLIGKEYNTLEEAFTAAAQNHKAFMEKYVIAI